MLYVALLRGINVGGNSKVSMAQLKTLFERIGVENVKTYINSGNVLFSDDTHSVPQLITKLEAGIQKEFGFSVKVLIRDFDNIKQVVAALPKNWVNDLTMKTDVMFLWPAVDSKDVLKKIVIKEKLDRVKYVPGAILWSVDRKDVTRSGMMRLAGTKLYKEMTIRNCNTVRKLFLLMSEAEKTL